MDQRKAGMRLPGDVTELDPSARELRRLARVDDLLRAVAARDRRNDGARRSWNPETHRTCSWIDAT